MAHDAKSWSRGGACVSEQDAPCRGRRLHPELRKATSISDDDDDESDGNLSSGRLQLNFTRKIEKRDPF